MAHTIKGFVVEGHYSDRVVCKSAGFRMEFGGLVGGTTIEAFEVHFLGIKEFRVELQNLTAFRFVSLKTPLNYWVLFFFKEIRGEIFYDNTLGAKRLERKVMHTFFLKRQVHP